MKKLLLFSCCTAFLFACGSSGTEESGTNESKSADVSTYDPHRGEGKFSDYEAGAFNATLASQGKAVYEAKCQSCHKLSDERLVGPGWKGITERRTPSWILNFITNPDPMIDKDPQLQAQLEICMVRMPNQNLSDEEAKNLFEYMRQNDGAQ